MAEYIERSVGVSILRAKANMAVLSDAALYFEKAAQMLEKLPAADVAPVVRCKDCTHLRPEVDAYTQETVGYWCTELDIGSVDVDDFCSRGERKDGADHE